MKRTCWWVAGLTLLAALLRLYRLGAESLWFDEGWSAQVATMEWTTLRNVLRTQPFPFYYATLHLWARLGSSEWMLRLLSAMAGTLCVPLLYEIVRFCLGRPSAGFAALILAISPLHIWYSQEARMYALGTLLALGATWAFLRALESGRWGWWGAYACLSALAMYAFYYTAFIWIAHGVFLLYLLWDTRHPTAKSAPADIGTIEAKGQLARWLIAQASAWLIFAPGARVLLDQLLGGTWEWVALKYGRPTLRSLLHTGVAFSVGEMWNPPLTLRWGTFAAFALAFLAGVFAFPLSRKRPFFMRLERGVVFLLLYLVLPVGAIFLLSQFRPGYLVRYLVIFLPAYSGLLGRGLATLRLRALAWVLFAVLVLVSGLSLGDLYRLEQKENWRGLASYIQDQARKQDVIVLVDEDVSAVFGYYYRGALPVVGVSSFLQDQAALGDLAGRLRAGRSRLWLVMSHTTNEALFEQLASDARFRLTDERAFTGIRLALFEILE